MKQESLEVLEIGARTLSFGSGIVTSAISFFEIYATALGSVFTILTFLAYVFFGILNKNKLDKTLANEKRLDSVDHHLEDNTKMIIEVKDLLIEQGKSNEKVKKDT